MFLALDPGYHSIWVMILQKHIPNTTLHNTIASLQYILIALIDPCFLKNLTSTHPQNISIKPCVEFLAAIPLDIPCLFLGFVNLDAVTYPISSKYGCSRLACIHYCFDPVNSAYIHNAYSHYSLYIIPLQIIYFDLQEDW